MGSKPCNNSNLQLSCQKLPSEVISSIRSGITITSVSKCVEELVLNSIDARATNIGVSVNLETFRVRVEDNGQGITKEDLAVIGERYRTSKCHSLKDLDINVNQYGFRGEAISSIINVSKEVEIRTSCGNKDIYCRRIKYGKDSSRIFKTSDSAKSSGCTVYVYGVLASQPVRQNRIDKSLELEEIKKTLQVIALINFNVGITLRNDVTGASLFHATPSRSIKEAYINFTKPRYGINPHENVIEVDYSQDCIVLKGFVSTEGHGSRGLQLIYVNKRFAVKTKLFKLVNSGLIPILGLKGSSKSSQTSTQGGSYSSRAISSTSSSASSSEKYPVFLINVVCPGTEFDFICDEVKFRNMETVTKAVAGFLSTFKMLLSRQNRPQERQKNEQLLAGHPQIIATSSKIRNDSKHKTLSNIFKTNINNDSNNNNNNTFKTPSTAFKECIGNQITVNDMKRAIQSKAIVREREINHDNDGDDRKSRKRKSVESLDEEAVGKSKKTLLNDFSNEEQEKVNVPCNNTNSQKSQRILSKTNSSSSSCSSLSRAGPSASSTPVSITSQKLNYQKPSQLQSLVDNKSPLCTITTRVTKRKVPAQLDIVQRRKVNQNDTNKPLISMNQPSKFLLDAEKSKMAIQDILDAVWIPKKQTPQASEKLENYKINKENPMESPKLNISIENLYKSTDSYNIGKDNDVGDLVPPSSPIRDCDYQDFSLLPLSAESHKSESVRNHSQEEQEQYDKLFFVSDNEINDVDNEHRDTEEGEENKFSNNFQSVELVTVSDSNKANIEDFEEQDEIIIKTTNNDNSYHSKEKEEIMSNDNDNQMIEEQNQIKSSRSHHTEEQENITNYTSHAEDKEVEEVIDIYDDSEYSEKSITDYVHDTEDDELDEDFCAMSDELYNSCYPKSSRVDDIKSSYGQLYLWNKKKEKKDQEKVKIISSQESSLTNSELQRINTEGQMTRNTINISSSSSDDVSLFGRNGESLSRSFTSDNAVDNVSQYFNSELQEVEVEAEKSYDTVPKTHTNHQNSINVPNVIPEQFSIEDNKNLDNEKLRHFKSVNYFNIPNSNPPDELPSPNKETLTQDSSKQRTEEEQEKEEQILASDSFDFLNNHDDDNDDDNNNIIDDGNIQVNFISQQSSILSFPISEKEQVLLNDNEEEEKEQQQKEQSQENKQQVLKAPLVIVPYDIEATLTPDSPSIPHINNDVHMDYMNDCNNDVKDNALINDDDDELEQDENLHGRKLQLSPYFNCNNNNSNDNAVSNYDNTDCKTTQQQPPQLDVLHNEIAPVPSPSTTQNKILDLLDGKQEEPPPPQQQRDIVDNCLSRINQQPLTNFRRAWLKTLMPETAKIFGQQIKQDSPSKIGNINSIKRNSNNNNNCFEKMHRMGNLSLAANDNLLVGRAIRSVMSQNGDDLVTNKWRIYNQNEIQPTITSLVENYSSQFSCEDDWSISKGPLELPVVNLNAQEVNLMCRKLNSAKTCCRFSKEDMSRVQVIGNIDCKFISAKVTIKQTSFGAFPIGAPLPENESQTMLVLFDQHAVHERILLEQYIEDAFEEVADGKKKIAPALLNVPMMMDFPEFEVRILKAYEKEFEFIGITTEILSPQTVKVLSIPMCFVLKVEKEATCHQPNTVRKLTQSLIQEEVQHIKQTNGTISSSPKTVMDALKSLACRRAVKFGDPLTREQSEKMINELKNCKVPFQCAHGRPVLVPLLSLNT